MDQTPTDLAFDPILSSVPVREGYKVLGGIVLYQKLGQGGMGAVYRGRHLRLDIEVAVKVMAPRPQALRDQAERSARRFVREARAAAAVRHANLIRVYDVNSESGVQFLIMDYVDGESAGDRLARKRRLPEAEAVRVALAAAEGLAAAHERAIVHRDVKSENILIDSGGNVVLVDLGLAKAFDSPGGGAAPPGNLSVSWETVGTPNYMSPEQTRASRDIGPPADVWSLGVTLYELVTGWLPFRDEDVNDLIYRIRRDPLPDLRAGYPDLSEGLCVIVEKALEKDPARRYADCGELGRELREHLAALPDAPELVGPEADGAGPPIEVRPPPGRVLNAVAASLFAGVEAAGHGTGEPPGAGAERESETGQLVGAGGRRTITDLIERRARVESARLELGEPGLEGEADLFRLVDTDIRIAEELEKEDPRRALEHYERLAEALAALRTRRRALEGVDWSLLHAYYRELHESAKSRIEEADELLRGDDPAASARSYVRIAASLGEAELLAETRRQGRSFTAAMAASAGVLGAVIGGIMPVASRFVEAARWAVPAGACCGVMGGAGFVVFSLLTVTGFGGRGVVRRAATVLGAGALGGGAGLATAAAVSWMHSLLRDGDATVAVVRAAAFVGAALGAVAGPLAPNRAGRSLFSKTVIGLVLGGLFMVLLASWVPMVTRQGAAGPREYGSIAGMICGFVCGIGLGMVAGVMNAASEKGAVARLALTRRTAAEGRSER